jgi:NitT/TauT family transport system substrate-binding protein
MHYVLGVGVKEEGMRPISVAALCAAVILSVGACGGDDDSGGTGTPAEPGGTTRLKLSYIPYVGAAPFKLGIEKGFFKKHGIELEESQGVAPAPIMAQVTSGQLDIGFTTIPALIAAVSSGAPLKAIAPVDGVIDPENPQSAILVKNGSGIQSPKDLVGKKVGVVALQSELDVLLHEVVRRDGGDQKQVQSVQVPFPEMNAALKAGRVDAVVNTEPFVTLGLKEGGLEAINYPEVDVVPNLAVTAFVSSEKFIQGNTEVVKNFRAAMEESLRYAARHPAEARETMVEVADMKPALLDQINLGVIFEPRLDVASIEPFRTLMQDFGYVKDPPPASDLLATE